MALETLKLSATELNKSRKLSLLISLVTSSLYFFNSSAVRRFCLSGIVGSAARSLFSSVAESLSVSKATGRLPYLNVDDLIFEHVQGFYQFALDFLNTLHFDRHFAAFLKRIDPVNLA